MKRVLVCAPNWVGDCFLATPFLETLRRRHPDGEIAVLARPKTAEIFRGLAEEVILRDGFFSAVRLLRRCRWDAGYLLPNSFSSALLFFLAGVRRRIGYAADGRSILLTDPIPLPKRPEHRVISYVRLADPEASEETVTPRTHPLRIQLPQNPKNVFPEIHGENLVALNPGSAKPSKRWPAERFGELARRLCQSGSRIVWVGGPAREEVELARRALETAGGTGFFLAGRTGLSEIVCILSRMRLLVTGDTGLMHAAAAAGCPILVLVGATDLRVTSPWIRGERGVPSFSYIFKGVYCSPCVKNFCPNRREPMLCMTSISVEEVFQACRKILENPVPVPADREAEATPTGA